VPNPGRFHFRNDPQPVKAAKKAVRQKVAWDNEDLPPLWEKLRGLRLEIAKEQGVPPYMVFNDKTLKEMAVRRPATREALLDISGVGERKAELYGERFLQLILQNDDRLE
jgi:ATP-dependent DNA helicase RecQ